MSTEREAFLNALAANEDDTTTRLVYADWLDEIGEYDEADRQRKWPAAKAWLMEFADDEDDFTDEDDYRPCFSYSKLLEYGRRAREEGEFAFHCGANQSMQDELNDNRQEFWLNWSIVTGIPLPDGWEEQTGYFSCSC